METTPPKIGKFSLIYGLILGGLGIVFGVMQFIADAHTSQSPVNSVVSIVMMIAIIFWGITSFRKANGGFLTVGEALKLGAGIALVAGILGVLYFIFLANVLDPDFVSKSIDSRLAETAAEMDLTTEQIQQQKEMSMKFWWVSYPVILVVNIILGLIIGLVGGLIFKKARPDY